MELRDCYLAWIKARLRVRFALVAGQAAARAEVGLRLREERRVMAEEDERSRRCVVLLARGNAVRPTETASFAFLLAKLGVAGSHTNNPGTTSVDPHSLPTSPSLVASLLLTTSSPTASALDAYPFSAHSEEDTDIDTHQLTETATKREMASSPYLNAESQLKLQVHQRLQELTRWRLFRSTFLRDSNSDLLTQQQPVEMEASLLRESQQQSEVLMRYHQAAKKKRKIKKKRSKNVELVGLDKRKHVQPHTHSHSAYVGDMLRPKSASAISSREMGRGNGGTTLRRKEWISLLGSEYSSGALESINDCYGGTSSGRGLSRTQSGVESMGGPQGRARSERATES